MSRVNTDQIIAHVELLRAVDRLLSQADIVREKRRDLDKLLSAPGDARPTVEAGTKGGRHAE
jgi:hypothetical protein